MGCWVLDAYVSDGKRQTFPKPWDGDLEAPYCDGAGLQQLTLSRTYWNVIGLVQGWRGALSGLEGTNAYGIARNVFGFGGLRRSDCGAGDGAVRPRLWR